MDYNRKKLRLGDVLVNNGVISAEDLQKGLELQKGSGRKLGETLVTSYRSEYSEGAE